MLIEPLPDPRNPGRNIPDTDFSVGDIIGLFFAIAIWCGFFYVVDAIGTAFEIPTLLAIPATIAVGAAVFFPIVYAIALPFLAIEYCSIEQYSGCSRAMLILAAFLVSMLICVAVAAGLYAFL